MWSAIIAIALRAIRVNALRSILTTLGIVLGVASVIAMVTLGESAAAQVTGEISKLGSDLLIVSPGASQRGPVRVGASSFTNEDIRAIRRELPAAIELAPSATLGVLLVNGSANYSSIVFGTTNEFFSVRKYRIARGRDFSDTEATGGATLCVLGETVRRELFGGQDALGAVIRVGRTACTVIGVVESKGQSSFGSDQDDFVVMPLLAVQRRIAGNQDVASVFVSAPSGRELGRTKSTLQAVLRERRHIQPGQNDDFSVEDTREIAKTISGVTQVLTTLLGAVAAISLVVGGIGIMNIMLVSVTERTREIGVRLAIGALPGEVLLQFLIEAILLCVLGGLAGVLLGVSGSYVATRAFGVPFVLRASVVAGSLAVAAGVGIAFGYLPARRAARLDPIEALRHE